VTGQIERDERSGEREGDRVPCMGVESATVEECVLRSLLPPDQRAEGTGDLAALDHGGGVELHTELGRVVDEQVELAGGIRHGHDRPFLFTR
jgi:hypothetical protein